MLQRFYWHGDSRHGSNLAVARLQSFFWSGDLSCPVKEHILFVVLVPLSVLTKYSSMSPCLIRDSTGMVISLLKLSHFLYTSLPVLFSLVPCLFWQMWMFGEALWDNYGCDVCMSRLMNHYELFPPLLAVGTMLKFGSLSLSQSVDYFQVHL